MLALAGLVVAAAPLVVDVYVPLCDGKQLACGPADGLGDPRDLDRNLYWGARYGAERFLKKAPGFAVTSTKDAPDAARPALLRDVVIERAPSPSTSGERKVILRLHAYAGDRLDDAVHDFFAAVAAPGGDLVVWSGHDRLMDVEPPTSAHAAAGTNVAVLACESERYFGPALTARGAHAVAMTRTFMAPEAYLLEALAGALAVHGVDDVAVHDALVAAYAKYQRVSPRAAATVFTAPR